MRNNLSAERLLCLLTQPDRALSIIGDLSEEAQCRGVLWFWSQVIRTAAGLFSSNLASAPIRVSGLIVLGLALLHLARRSAAPMMIALYSAQPRHEMTFFLSAILWPLVVAPLLIGFLVAGFNPRREVATCAALAFFSELFVLGYLAWAQTAGYPFWKPFDAAGVNLIPASCVMLASVAVRHWRNEGSRSLAAR